METQRLIENKLQERLEPSVLEVVNESGMHNVPVGAESHFRVLVVSSAFEGKSLLERHRLVYDALGEDMRERIHALAISSRTPTEWAQGKLANESPPCRGGPKG